MLSELIKPYIQGFMGSNVLPWSVKKWSEIYFKNAIFRNLISDFDILDCSERIPVI